MNLSDINPMSQLMQRQMGLDPPLTRDLIVERDLPVPMPDGIVLLADRWAPRVGGDSLPVALVRSPYGRGALFSAGMIKPLAERGFQVILQSVRGTFGSGGTFEPMRNEREDGLATLDWVVKQSWFGDSIVLVGPSYLGYVQWAVADRLRPEVKAMIPQITEAGLTLDFLRPGAFSLETPFGWGVMVDGQERRGAILRLMIRVKKNEQAMRTLPLGQADVAALGHHTQYTQDILAHDADDPAWRRTAPSPPSRPTAALPTRTGTTQPTPPLRSAACAWSSEAPAGPRTPSSRHGRTCSPTPPRRLTPTWRWSARSARRSGSSPASRTPTSSSASATSIRKASPGTSATASPVSPAPTNSPA
jgi:predicted acyl esterase